jgi:glycosyltransferase involved in cell wall biosynthesis
MDRYRILHFTSSLKVGGAEHHLLNLCRYLKGAGHEPVVCTISAAEEGIESVLMLEDVPIYRLPLRSLAALPTPAIDRSLRRILGECEPDLLHGHLFHGEVVAAWARLRSRAPLVVTRHSAGLEFGGWRRILARWYGRAISRCIAVSREAGAEARRMGYPDEKISILPNAIDARRFRPLGEPGRREGRRSLIAELFHGEDAERVMLIGSVGGLKPVKAYSLFVRAAARRAAGGSENTAAVAPRFVIFGEGPERAGLEELARSLGLGRFLALPGRRDDVEDVYPLLDAFVLTSRSEGVPLALLEAMSAGVPCVASDVGGIAEVLGDTGLVVSSGDEEGFAEALARLAADRALRSDLGRRSRVRVLERYDVDIWGERITAIYGDALAGISRRG